MTKKSIAKLIVLGITIDMLVFGPRLIRKIAASRMPKGFPVQSISEYAKDNKNTPSDIDGWSIYDKYKHGLSLENGSDSDRDGLSDKEEIEVYHSDPLKASTSGDLYSDRYKVDHGMDLQKKYPFQNDLHFNDNKCPEVHLTANDALDFRAVVEPLSVEKTENGYSVLAGYSLYNYSGTAVIDVSELQSRYHLKERNIRLVIQTGETSKLSSARIKHGKLRIKGLQNSICYDLYLVRRNDWITLKNTLSGHTAASNPEPSLGVIWGSSVSPAFGGKIHVLCQNSDQAECFQQCVKQVYDVGSDDILIQSADNETIQRTVRWLRVFPVFEWKNGDSVPWYQELFCWMTYDTVLNYLVSTQSAIAPQHTLFQKGKDELPFHNFNSDISPQGNCAGIASYTARLFNEKTVPGNGNYIIGKKFGIVSWNIEKDSENQTLLNPELFDYKNSKFVDPSGNLPKWLTSGEQEFVKMIGCY